MCSLQGLPVYWILWASQGSQWSHTCRLQAPYSPHDRSYWVFPSLYVIRTDQYSTCMCTLRNLYGTLRGSCVHVAKTPGRPLTARMHLTTPSQEDFVWTSRGTSPYGFANLAYNRSFEAYRSMCRRPLHELYHKLYVNVPNILELYSQPKYTRQKETHTERFVKL